MKSHIKLVHDNAFLILHNIQQTDKNLEQLSCTIRFFHIHVEHNILLIAVECLKSKNIH